MKKLDLVVCAVFFATAVWSSTVSSALYLVGGVGVTLALLCSREKLAQRVLYAVAVGSGLLLLVKSLPLLLVWLRMPITLSPKELSTYLGVFYDPQILFHWNTVFTYLPEVLCLPLSYLVAHFWREGSELPKTQLFPLFTVFLLLAAGVCVRWWFGLAYLVLGCTWALSLVWWQWAQRWVAVLAAVVAVAHFCLSYTEHLLNLFELDVDYEAQMGILDTKEKPLIVLCLALLIYFHSGVLGQVSERLDRQSTGGDLLTPLISEDQKRIAQSMTPMHIRMRPRTRTLPSSEFPDSKDLIKKSFTMASQSYELSLIPWLLRYLQGPEFTLVVARVLAVSWLAHYQCLSSLLVMLWVFLSCFFYKDDDMLRKLTSLLLLPVLLLQMVTFYVWNILSPVPQESYEKYGLQSFSSPEFEFFLQVCVFSWCVFTANRLQDPLKDPVPKSESLRVIIHEVVYSLDKFSICVLFLVGLSSIDLMHTVLMVLCSVFLLNLEKAKAWWRGLMIYTVLMLIGLYVWMLLLNLTDIELDNAYLWKVLGVETKVGELGPIADFIPRNYLLFALFYSEFMQMVMYDIQDAEHYRYISTERVSVLLNPLLWVKKWIQYYVSSYQIWVMYSLILGVMVISTQNVLNFLRFVLLIIFFVVHFNDKTLEIGRNKLKVIWFALKYYSGLILVLRYIYQFSYSDESESNSELSQNLRLLGIERYEVTELYKAMTWDSIIFLGSVLAERSLLPQASNVSERSSVLYGIAEIFGKSMMVGLCAVAIYWRLSVSMLLILLCVLFFLCSAVTYHYQRLRSAYETKEVVHMRDGELSLRQRAWDALFLVCILFMLMDYGAFLLDRQYMLTEEFESAIWIMFALGVNKPGQDEYLFSEMNGYILILALLVVEKHCVEYLKTHTEPKVETRYEITLSFQVWNHFRVIYEEALLLCVLVVAFSKLTVVSLLYVFTVFALCFMGTDNRKKLIILTYVVSFSIFAQYSVILSNLRAEISPIAPPIVETKPLPIPWYPSLNWGDPTNPQERPHIEDDPTFLNLGTSTAQIYNIVYDVLVLLGILIYFEYMDERRLEVARPEQLQEGDQQEQDKTIPFRVKVKNFFYSTAHIFILVLVLIFVSQSSGLTSVIYCLFSLAFLMEANTLLKLDQTWEDFKKLLEKYFLTFLILDLAALIIYQIPLAWLHTGTQSEFLKAFGLLSLWRAGDQQESAEAHIHYDWVLFKIWTFAFLRLLTKMFANDDFKEYITKYHNEIKDSAEDVCKRTAEEFNNSRIHLSNEFAEKKRKIKEEGQKMLKEVSEWYEQGKEKSQMEVKSAPELSVGVNDWFKNQLLARLSKPLFQSFVSTLALKRGENQPAGSPELISPPASGVPEDEGKIHLTCKRFFLLFWYIICSHTQEICFLLFFLNHYFYASFESIIFPLSALW